MLPNAETCAVVRQINPASEFKFDCRSQSFMRTPGEIISLVWTDKYEVQMICYNQLKDTISIIHNYGYYWKI